MAKILKNRELDPKLAAILASITERAHARSRETALHKEMKRQRSQGLTSSIKYSTKREITPERLYFSTFREAMLWLKDNPKSAIVRNPSGEGFMTLYPIK